MAARASWRRCRPSIPRSRCSAVGAQDQEYPQQGPQSRPRPRQARSPCHHERAKPVQGVRRRQARLLTLDQLARARHSIRARVFRTDGRLSANSRMKESGISSAVTNPRWAAAIEFYTARRRATLNSWRSVSTRSISSDRFRGRRVHATGRPSNTAALEGICCDMRQPYIDAIKARAPQAVLVFDKFHIVRHLMEAVDQVRRDEGRERGPAHKALMCKTRFIWLKNPWRKSRNWLAINRWQEVRSECRKVL